MDPKLLLVKIITLLFRESQLEDNNDGSAEYVTELLTHIEPPAETMDSMAGREVHMALRRTIAWMCKHPADQQFDTEALLQRIRVDCGDDASLYGAIADGFYAIDDVSIIKRKTIDIRRDLNKWETRRKVKEIFKRAATPILYGNDDSNWDTIVSELVGDLEGNMTPANSTGDPGVVARASTRDAAGMAEHFKQAQEEASTEGILKTGWQGINRMLGEQGGLKRGDFVLVGALQHNNKSGFTLDMTRQIAVYNKPFMLDEKKKPLIIHVSAENQLTNNMIYLYKQIMENKTGKLADYKTVTPEEASATVINELKKTGYEFEFLRINPSEYSFRKLFDYVKEMESLGFEIHLITFDYLNMISKEGCTAGPYGAEIRDLFRRVRNFMSARKITFITPHQLAPDAKQLLRAGMGEDLPKECAGKGYWDSCKAIDQEVDVELVIHIVIIDGVSYQCIQRGKHRVPTITPERDKYCVLQFHPVAGLVDDVGKKDLSRRKAGGETLAEGGAGPWFSFDEQGTAEESIH